MASKLARQVLNYRTYATVQGPSATAGEHGGGSRMWKLLSFLVAVPGVAVCYINAEMKESEHRAHHHRPDFVPYEHLQLRSKMFPWGDGNHSLFHNKDNALPEGYEE